MQDFKKLRVWHLAHALARNVYRSCPAASLRRYPGKRRQILKCADSIPSNISEGSAKSDAEFARYLDMSLGSVKELENHLIFIRDEAIISVGRFDWLDEQVEHVRRMLINLIRRIRNPPSDDSR